MFADRDAAIQDFADSADLDRRVMEAIVKILAKSPRAVMIAWEDETTFAMTCVPFSRSLIKGMVDNAFDAVFGDEPAAGPEFDD